MELAETASAIERAAATTLADPRGRWILAPHDEAESECSLTGLIDGELISVQIDRTFVDELGVRWIIDFKHSTQEASGPLENFIESEVERYREQLERYARLMAQREARPIRLALYFPLLGVWREWAARTVFRRQATLFEM
jgi:hypothetical protein